MTVRHWSLLILLLTPLAFGQETKPAPKPRIALPAQPKVVFKTDFPTPGEAALGENSLKGFVATVNGEESKFDPKFLPKTKAKSLFVVNGTMEFEFQMEVANGCRRWRRAG